MTPVTDPTILAQLNAAQTAGPQPVTDPAILAAAQPARTSGSTGRGRRRRFAPKSAKLPESDRPEAMRQWADANVASERAAQERLPTRGPFVGGAPIDPNRAADALRNMARGTVAGPWLDETLAGASSAAHSVTGGRVGSPYDEAVAYQRAQDRALDREMGGQGAALQVGGALAGGGIAYSAARRLGLPALTASTVPRQAAVLAPVGAVQAANYAAGVSEGTPSERVEAGAEAIPFGLMVGALAPPVMRGAGWAGQQVRDAASPTLARWRADIGEIPRRMGIHASADGSPPQTAGARAAGEQVIANRLLQIRTYSR